MKKITSLFIVLFSVLNVSAQIDLNALKRSVFDISSEELLGHVKELSDDKYLGRLTGSPEYNEVSKWLADYFEDLGLEPGAGHGEWFQWFDRPYTLVKSDCSLELLLAQKKDLVQDRFLKLFL